MGNFEAELEAFFAKSNLPVLFAGAGVSAHAGLPTWPAYLTELASLAFEYDPQSKYMMDREISKGALDLAASYYRLCDIPEATKLEGLSKPLKSFDANKLVGIQRLPFAAIVTTNFDRAMHASYAKAKSDSAQEANIDDPSLTAACFWEDFYVARIHGRVEIPEGMRLTREDFVALKVNSEYSQFLTHLFTRRQVLFVGFSFLDPAIIAVLREVKATFHSAHKQEHAAIVPKSASAEFLRELSTHSIRRIEYDDSGGHQVMWDAFDRFPPKAPPSPNVAVIVPFKVAKQYMAAAYARMRVGGRGGALVRSMSEGIVSGMLQRAGAAGLTEPELVSRVASELTIDEDVAGPLVGQSLSALVADEVCGRTLPADGERYFAKDFGESTYETSIQRLIDGAVKRFIVREGGKDASDIRTFLHEFFVTLILRRGWDLGAAYAAGRKPEDVDVLDSMKQMTRSGRLAATSLTNRLAASVEDLLLHPDETEAEFLAELGRLGFGLELLLESPHDALFYRRTLPEKVYVDANVLMPSIVPGHPHMETFRETIKSLRKAGKNSGLELKICVIDGFLNEIISHRQLAIDQMREQQGEGALWAEREAQLYGTANVNVFVGAFFNQREAKTDLTFDEFLKKSAPYRTEAELGRFVEGLGYQVIKVAFASQLAYPKIEHSLEIFYASHLEYGRKHPKVISHDASQLAILNWDLENGVRSIFVSADRRLRQASDGLQLQNVSNSFVSHLGLYQLVDLLVGSSSKTHGVASMLWMSSVSSATERIRNHLIALALDRYDAAMAMEMPRVVDAIAEDAANELESKGISLDIDSSPKRAEMNRTIDRYERDFFEKLVQAMKKRGLAE
ncbi:MAG: SIR2 family protein [Xanthomonadales bacterium]|nr:SIR2 family protein [Xanthomonadales bacterium]